MNTIKKTQPYENYPAGTVIISNLVSLLLYTSGIFIMYRINWVIALLFVFYIFALEYRLIAYHCVNCHYWGKICGFGKGKLSALFFSKGIASKFCAKDFTWKSMIPDILLSLIPLISGIVLLLIKFDYLVLISLIIILILTSSGNAVIRGKLTCKYCKQKELGCPAEQLFNK